MTVFPSAAENASAAVSQSVRGPLRHIVLSEKSPGVSNIDPAAVPKSATGFKKKQVSSV